MGRARTGGGGQLRIIGGQWRGRRIAVTDAPGLRPTGDRVRETLFNWIAPQLPGARCLDLFAGSGALGLEALSRGAAAVDFVDSNRAAARQLQAALSTLGAGEQARVWQVSAESFLRQPVLQEPGSTSGYDIVFLDPPFGGALLSDTCERLAGSGRLRPQAQVYIECDAAQAPALPSSWHCRRDKRAGGVRFALYDT